MQSAWPFCWQQWRDPEETPARPRSIELLSECIISILRGCIQPGRTRPRPPGRSAGLFDTRRCLPFFRTPSAENSRNGLLHERRSGHRPEEVETGCSRAGATIPDDGRSEKKGRRNPGFEAHGPECAVRDVHVAGVETDYTIMIEKKYFRSFALSKESQRYARKLLAMDPPVCDAHLTVGMVEYVVSNMNWFFRLFVHFNQIEGSKQKAIENLKDVVAGGQYYGPLAKILLSVIYLRENQPQQALALMKEMERDFPENPLIQSEVKKISRKIADAKSGTN